MKVSRFGLCAVTVLAAFMMAPAALVADQPPAPPAGQLAQVEVQPQIPGTDGPIRPEDLVPLRPFPVQLPDYHLRSISLIWPLCQVHEARINLIRVQLDIYALTEDCITEPVRVVAEVGYSDGSTETITRDFRGFCRPTFNEATGTYFHTSPLQYHPAEPFSVERFPVSVIGFVDPHDTIEELNEDNNVFNLDIARYRRENCV